VKIKGCHFGIASPSRDGSPSDASSKGDLMSALSLRRVRRMDFGGGRAGACDPIREQNHFEQSAGLNLLIQMERADGSK
jgi:hypothetical protein